MRENNDLGFRLEKSRTVAKSLRVKFNGKFQNTVAYLVMLKALTPAEGKDKLVVIEAVCKQYSVYQNERNLL